MIKDYELLCGEVKGLLESTIVAASLFGYKVYVGNYYQNKLYIKNKDRDGYSWELEFHFMDRKELWFIEFTTLRPILVRQSCRTIEKQRETFKKLIDQL